MQPVAEQPLAADEGPPLPSAPGTAPATAMAIPPMPAGVEQIPMMLSSAGPLPPALRDVPAKLSGQLSLNGIHRLHVRKRLQGVKFAMMKDA